MSICLDHESFEYQSLKNRTDIPGFHFDAICSYYLENYGRFPKLDEIPNINSINILSKKYGDPEINSDESTDIEYFTFIINKSKLESDLNKNNKEDIQKRLIELYPDLDIKVSLFDGNYRIKTKRIASKWYIRPHTYTSIRSDINTESFNVTAINSYITKAMERLGRNIYSTNDLELSSKKWQGIVDRSKTVKAFIYNGDIYINTDHATIDDYLHEFLHLVLGSIAQHEGNDLYYKLLEYMQYDEDWYNQQLEEYIIPGTENKLDRAKIDILEELFVKEISKYLTGQKNKISELSKNKNFSNIHIQIIQDLFSGFNQILNSDYSIETNISEEEYKNPLLLFQKSLSHIAQNTGSNIFKENVIEASDRHRMRANLIQKYLKYLNVEERC